MAIASVNPANGRLLKSFEEAGGAEIEAALTLAESTFRSWRRSSFADRAAKMLRAAEILEEDKRRFGEIIVDDKCHTSVPGLFAAGDVTTVPYKQIHPKTA